MQSVQEDPAHKATQITGFAVHQKTERLRKLHHIACLQKKVVQRLKDKLDMHISSQGVTVEDPIHNDLVAIMKKHSASVLSNHGEESFQGIFWSQHNCSNQHIRKTMASSYYKWGLYLHQVSSKAPAELYVTISKHLTLYST